MNLPVRTEWISLANGFDAYLALPPSGTGPGLLLCQEIFGVNAHIRGVAEQYALDGYVVLAPDLFWRQGARVDLGYEGEDRQRGFALMQGYGVDDALADLNLATRWLRGSTAVTGGRVGAIGYCMGGRMAFLAAADCGVDAAVAYYGGGIAGQLERAPRVSCPVQFHHAGQDPHIPASAVASIEAAMAGRPTEFHVYDDAQHGFNCWARGSYQARSATLARGRSLCFLGQHLWS